MVIFPYMPSVQLNEYEVMKNGLHIKHKLKSTMLIKTVLQFQKKRCKSCHMGGTVPFR